MSTSIQIPGAVAQDKDWARIARVEHILPALAAGRSTRLDFDGIEVATQSFIHALLSEATRIYGEPGLKLIEFHSCVPQVKQTVQTVVEYSLRARAMAVDRTPGEGGLRSSDVPQADDLQKVRVVVDIASDGPIPVDIIARIASYSIRHAYYRVNAARCLGLLVLGAGIAVITDRGQALARTRSSGLDEQQAFREAVASSTALRKLVPGLLRKRPPKVDDLVSRMMRLAGLSAATAARRTQCLLSWRRQLLNPQLTLPTLSSGVELDR